MTITYTARQAERRDVAFPDLTVIADRLDYVVDPFLAKAKGLSVARRDAEEAHHDRVFALQL